MVAPFLVYGANGYTGRLVAALAAERGLRPVLAGRSEAKVRELAEQLGFEARIVGLDDPEALQRALDGVSAVLHCAGPFSSTAAPMVDACLATGTHYLDITGEVAVFEALARRDAEAQGRGVVLMPGVGFDVVPSDCLALHLATKLPDATKLCLAFAGLGRISHGTARTVGENLGRGAAVREAGRLVPIPLGSRRRAVDFGPIQSDAVAIAWGDLSTAFRSTGIPDIEVYMAMPTARLRGLWAMRILGPLLDTAPVQALVRNRIDAGVTGPTPEQRASSSAHLWGQASAPGGRTVEARIHTPDGYDLTADAALRLVTRIAAGEGSPGFRTPAEAFGSDFVLELDGVTREDLPT